MVAQKTGGDAGNLPVQSDYPELKIEERLSLFHSGTECRAYEFMGSHPAVRGSDAGFLFRVWAPAAKGVSLIGDFNNWNHTANPLEKISAGVWQAFVPGLTEDSAYRFAVAGTDEIVREKSDPYAYYAEPRPKTASKTCLLDRFAWSDEDWTAAKTEPYRAPLNIYEVHLGSWRRGDGDRTLSYPEIAETLIPYVKSMGYTHIELLPVMEHPQDSSWGYEVTGYFAPTSRYGSPCEFMRFVDLCHQAGVGVILDWVPAYFVKSGHGLLEFDGAPCYEYADPQKREHVVWGTRVFDYSRPEVQSFLLSSALFWMERFHADGLRVSALSGMLCLDFNRLQDPPKNCYGGNENLEAIAFLRRLNEEIFASFPFALMIAEESGNWPMVTRPTYTGGLGFNYKWNTGWANDSLAYMGIDPISRQYHHNKMTFSMMYSFSENYVLPLSHDESVSGKHSLMERIPGQYEDKFAGLRVYLAYMMAHPGKKLSFMGTELAQFNSWQYDRSLDWHLLEYDMHRNFQDYVRELNLFYLRHRPLWQKDDSWAGFQWINPGDYGGNTLSFRRIDDEGDELICIFSFSSSHRQGFRLGVPRPGTYREILSSSESRFGGWGVGNYGALKAETIPCNDLQWSLTLELPPLGAIFLTREPGA